MRSVNEVAVDGRLIGGAEPCFIIAEIGINHNGSVELARRLIDAAALSGCDAVKFQKRTPELCVPRDQWSLERETPWGRMSYLEYRHRIEFGVDEFAQIDQHCRRAGILWSASCWDDAAVDFMEQFDPPFYKSASACLTNVTLLRRMKSTGRPLIVSTGMSTIEEIDAAVAAVGRTNLLIAHSTSTYPCPPDELNLRMIETLQARYPQVPIGYSGHEVGLATTVAAVALGAAFIERHITLDRAMWGNDQAASVEPHGFSRLVRDIRVLEMAMGDGMKRVYPDEMPVMQRLRRSV